MTDIVERLRHQIVPDGWLELAEEAATEIERLQTANEYAFAELTATRAEIERLRRP